jgi:GAF domain-containing protein
MTDDLSAAVAAAVLGSETSYRRLLHSIVETARAIFSAQASSIFLFDETTDELVFEAATGQGSDTLVGMRLPSSTGIAGWVLVTRQPLVLDDVRSDPRFSRETAERTGFVPKGLMAVPLIHEEETLGVLQVLDRPQQSRFSLGEIELLGQFASQAAVALHLLRSARRAQAVLDGGDDETIVVARLATALESLEGERRAAGLRLLADLERLLGS